MQDPGLIAEATEPRRQLIQLVKTQNFVLEWIRHQARLKTDKARLLFLQPSPQASEVQDEREEPAPASDRSFNLANLMLTQI